MRSRRRSHPSTRDGAWSSGHPRSPTNQRTSTRGSGTRTDARERAEARADIERAGRLKDDFLAVLSHEVRTPLNAVMGYMQLLMSGAMAGNRILQAYQANSANPQAQARLVESLLDLCAFSPGSSN